MELIRKSPVALVVKIILAEILIEAIYLVLSLSLTQISEQLANGYEASRFALSVLFIVIAVSVIAVLVAQWANEVFILEKDDLAVSQGIISKRVQTYPYANMQSVTVNQSLLGRLFNYGNVTIYIPVLGKNVSFMEISSPYHFAEKLKSHIPYPEKNQFIIPTPK